jgi:hypothetical protein
MISDVVNFMSALGFVMAEEEIKDGVVIYVSSNNPIVSAMLFLNNGHYYYVKFNRTTKEWKKTFN